MFTVIAIIALLGAMTPGPNFVIVTKNTLAYSRITGLNTSLGVFLGILVHISYSLIGLDFLTEESHFIFNLIKYLGATYLIYLGVKSFFSSSLNHKNSVKDDRIILSVPPIVKIHNKKNDLSFVQGLRSGFFTNVLNPESSIFYLSVFSQLIGPDTPYSTQICYGLEMAIISLAWFVFLSYSLSNQWLQNRLISVEHIINNGMGLVLVGCGIRMALIYP